MLPARARAPHDARDFARILRAIYRSGPRWQPETLLDLADARTLKKLLANAGLPDMASRPPTTEEFLARQQWIPGCNPGLVALRALTRTGSIADGANMPRMRSADERLDWSTRREN